MDELKGISSHKFDNQTRIFTVIFNSKEIKKGKIIEAVESVEEQFKVKNWEIIQ